MAKTGKTAKTGMSRYRTDDYERIDIHVHADPSKYKGSPSAYVKRIRSEGIDRIMVFAPGEVCTKAVKKFGRSFVVPVPMYRLNKLPHEDLRKDMEYWLDHGCRAIKFISPLHPYSDDRYWPMYQMVLDHKALAIFHTGYLGFHGAAENPPIEMTNMRAAHIDAIARRFPDLRILMSHFSNPWWEEAWKVSWSKPNVYADLSGLTARTRSLDMWAQIFAPNGKLMKDSLKKICFASDVTYLHNNPHDFKPYIEFYENVLNRINAPESLRRLVWSGNAKKLFGLK
ncbi:MAG: amidohydrolase family protein [Planctomycetes bacterium]|nr:amidohydrolase family protein [Planctomycetota bacterium]